MSNPGAFAKREALRALSLVTRREWAESNLIACPQCTARMGGGSVACPYPNHWSGERLEYAYAALVAVPAADAEAETAEEQAEREIEIDAEAAAQQEDREDEETDPVAVKVTRADRDAAATIAGALRELIASTAVKPDLSQVKAMIDAAVAESRCSGVHPLTVKVNDHPAVDVGLAHRQFPLLLKMVAAGVNVWIAGPAGSGKTTAAEQVARALDLPFYFNGAIDTEYKLTGFVDAQGRIVSTPFRRAYTCGGVYLFDEADVSMPSALLAFNAALANGHADFPGEDRPVVRHPDFHALAGANTIGQGATFEYVGRNKIDAAFLDRFSMLLWTIDETLERALAGNDRWCQEVQRLRKVAADRGLRVIISPRASIRGARLLAAGLSWGDAVNMEIASRMSPADYKRLSE